MKIYFFFESTIWTGIVLSIIISLVMYIDGSNKKISVLAGLTPIFTMLIAVVFAFFTKAFYPAALDAHQIKIIFLYLPLVLLLYFFFTGDKRVTHEGILKTYAGASLLLFFMFVAYHPLPSGDFLDDDEHPCSAYEYHEMERKINISMIGCADKIYQWGKKKNIDICEVNRFVSSKIGATDAQGETYIFNNKCNFDGFL